MDKYLYKAIITPCVLEEFFYSKPHFRNYSLTQAELFDRVKAREFGALYRPEKQRENLYRALVAIRGIVNANIAIWNQTKFVTLTFRKNMRNVKEANRLFKLFIQRLKYEHYKDLKYIAVVEFQKRGAVHYHLLMNMPYIDVKVLTKIWGQGSNLKITRPRNIKNWGAYFAKHGTKAEQAGIRELVGQKKYFCSRGLLRPIVQYTPPLNLLGRLNQEKEYISIRGEKIKYRQTLIK